MILLDTDVFSFLELPDSPEAVRLSARIAELESSQSVATTVITYEEQARGRLAYINAARSTQHLIDGYTNLRRHIKLFTRIPVVDFDDAAAIMAESLRRSKLRLGTMDLRIAAIALSRDELLVSRNLRDFNRVPGLRVEDWTKP